MIRPIFFFLTATRRDSRYRVDRGAGRARELTKKSRLRLLFRTATAAELGCVVSCIHAARQTKTKRGTNKVCFFRHFSSGFNGRHPSRELQHGPALPWAEPETKDGLTVAAGNRLFIFRRHYLHIPPLAVRDRQKKKEKQNGESPQTSPKKTRCIESDTVNEGGPISVLLFMYWGVARRLLFLLLFPRWPRESDGTLPKARLTDWFGCAGWLNQSLPSDQWCDVGVFFHSLFFSFSFYFSGLFSFSIALFFCSPSCLSCLAATTRGKRGLA